MATPLTYRQWLQMKANDTNDINAWDRSASSALLQVVGDDGNLDGYAVQENRAVKGSDGTIYKTAGTEGDLAEEARGLMDVNAALWKRYGNYSQNADLVNQFNQESEGYAHNNQSLKEINPGSSYDANAVNLWDNTIRSEENRLGGLAGLLDELNRGTDSERDTKNNELQSGYNRSESEYNLGSSQNKQSLQTSKNTIADRASQGLRGLLRTLGAMGAGGSSAAIYNAPELVTAQANQERVGANQTFGQNQQNLDTNWGNFRIDHENDKKKLQDWYEGQRRENERTSINRKNDILGGLTSAYAQRGAAGKADGGRIRQITDQMNSNNSRLSELDRFQAPQYTGARATYTAPSISTYNTGNADITTRVSDAPQAGQSSRITPTLAMLMGLRDRKDTNPYGRR